MFSKMGTPQRPVLHVCGRLLNEGLIDRLYEQLWFMAIHMWKPEQGLGHLARLRTVCLSDEGHCPDPDLFLADDV